MGATFPVVARWYVPTPRRATARRRRAYAANTVGAALGALAAGLRAAAALGLRGTTWVGVALNLARGRGGVARWRG